MNIQHMKDFIELAQSTSITDAARYLNITQSALSKRLKSMERELGVTLLDRSSGQVKLTPEGEVFYSTCVDVVNRYREAENKFRRMKGLPEVHVGGMLHDSFVAHMLDVLQSESNRYRIISEDKPFELHNKPLENNGLDVVFAPLDESVHADTSRYSVDLLKTEPAYAMLNLDDEYADRETVSLYDLRDHYFIRLIDNHSTDDAWHAIELACRRCGFTPKSTPTVPSIKRFPERGAYLYPKSKGRDTRLIFRTGMVSVRIAEGITFDLYMIASARSNNQATARFIADVKEYLAREH